MASIVKQKIRDSVDSGPSSPLPELADKYMLSVTAGPSYDVSTHKRVLVNDPGATCTFSSEFMTVKVKVRIRNYRGLPKGSPSSSKYFEDPLHAKDSYGVAFSFVPKVDLPSTDMVWGNDLDHPVRDRLPPGVNTAFKIVKEFIDPGLSMDIYADKPWLYGPALSCWFKFRIGEKVAPVDSPEFPIAPDSDVLQEGGDSDGEDVRSKLGLPSDSEKRRKFFLKEENRKAFVFEKGRCYQGDFFNPYLDFSKFALQLPGFSIGVLKYINEKSHTLRYVFKNRQTGDLYFAVQLKLLFGDELKDALSKEDVDSQASAGGIEIKSETSDDAETASSTGSEDWHDAPSANQNNKDAPPDLLMPKLNQARDLIENKSSVDRVETVMNVFDDSIGTLLQSTKTHDISDKSLNIFRP